MAGLRKSAGSQGALNEWVTKWLQEEVNCYTKSWVKKSTVNKDQEWGYEGRNNKRNHYNTNNLNMFRVLCYPVYVYYLINLHMYCYPLFYRRQNWGPEKVTELGPKSLLLSSALQYLVVSGSVPPGLKGAGAWESPAALQWVTQQSWQGQGNQKSPLAGRQKEAESDMRRWAEGRKWLRGRALIGRWTERRLWSERKCRVQGWRGRERSRSNIQLFAVGRGQPESVTVLVQHFPDWIPWDTGAHRHWENKAQLSINLGNSILFAQLW